MRQWRRSEIKVKLHVALLGFVLWVIMSTDAEDKLEVDIMLVRHVSLPALRFGSLQNVGGNQ